VLEGQVQRRLPKLMDELPGVCFVARRGRKLIMEGKSHVVSLAFIVQRPGQSVTCEMALAAQRLARQRQQARSGDFALACLAKRCEWI
jgi:hypothetical protein